MEKPLCLIDMVHDKGGDFGDIGLSVVANQWCHPSFNSGKKN